MPPTLFLHIGHPKTGSSAFQACLAQSAPQLAAAGILYPQLSSFAAARRGHVNSGNLLLVGLDRNWALHTVLPVVRANTSCHTILFSNENLIHRMPEFFAAAPALQPLCRPHVLLALRNPLEQLASVYQQLVKRHCYTEDYGRFLREHHYRCTALLRSAEIVGALEGAGIAYSLLNYSVLRSGLVEALAACVGIPPGVLTPAALPPVNRSLSAVELQLLLLVNAIHGPQVGHALADALVNQLPTVESVRLGMDEACQRQVEAANRPALDLLNSRLPPDAQLSFEGPSDAPLPLQSGLSAAQLEVCRAVLQQCPQASPLTQTALITRLLRLLSRLLAARQGAPGPRRFPPAATLRGRG